MITNDKALNLLKFRLSRWLNAMKSSPKIRLVYAA